MLLGIYLYVWCENEHYFWVYFQGAKLSDIDFKAPCFSGLLLTKKRVVVVS